MKTSIAYAVQSAQNGNDADKRQMALTALRCMDLTSLGSDDTPQRIDALCAKAAHDTHGNVAAVCVYPGFCKQAFSRVAAQDIAVATVINFPSGKGQPAQTYKDTRAAIKSGANEIDIVLDYKSFLTGDVKAAREILKACRRACNETGRTPAKMKVILESSEFEDAEQLYRAAQLAIECGADFIKTSTGKAASGGATLEAAAVMLEAIAESGKDVGLKVSGGIKTVADAARYIALADYLLHKGWATPDRFRIGASGLLDDVVNVLKQAPPSPLA